MNDVRPDRTVSPADGRAGIDAALVRRLLAAQFPQWADLPVMPVEVDGWDNRTYRLGDAMSVRLPTHASYVAAVDKEDRWLPVLAPVLPLPIPEPIGRGRPDLGFPFPWSIRQWIDGSPAHPTNIADPVEFARTLAAFLRALRDADATAGPAAGRHSFFRGAVISHYDDETRSALGELDGIVDRQAAADVWDAALSSHWDRPPVWFHGDVASGNLLVRGGALAAVIDFGTCGVGDPACDLVSAWTFLTPPARAAFAAGSDLDEQTWARARGWALWKAVISVAADLRWGRDPDATTVLANRRIISTILDEHRSLHRDRD